MKHKIIGSIFPEKLIFDGKKYRTTKENLFLSLLSSKQRDLKLLEKRKATPVDGLSNWAPPSILFSNQFKEDLMSIYDLKVFYRFKDNNEESLNSNKTNYTHPNIILNQSIVD